MRFSRPNSRKLCSLRFPPSRHPVIRSMPDLCWSVRQHNQSCHLAGRVMISLVQEDNNLGRLHPRLPPLGRQLFTGPGCDWTSALAVVHLGSVGLLSISVIGAGVSALKSELERWRWGLAHWLANGRVIKGQAVIRVMFHYWPYVSVIISDQSRGVYRGGLTEGGVLAGSWLAPVVPLPLSLNNSKHIIGK